MMRVSISNYVRVHQVLYTCILLLHSGLLHSGTTSRSTQTDIVAYSNNNNNNNNNYKQTVKIAVSTPEYLN